MDYVSANGDMLINFRKIKYASNAKKLQKDAPNIDAAKYREIAERNLRRQSVEITPSLSRSRKNVSDTSALKITRMADNTHAAAAVAKQPVNRTCVNAAAKHTRTSAVGDKKITAENVRTAAAEFLAYSCEKKMYSETSKAEKTARFPIAFFATAAVVTLLFIMLIGAYSQLSEAISEKESYENAISAALSKKDELETEISEKLSLDEIENIAVNKLGMVKANGDNVGYISIAGEDKIVVSESDEASAENMSIVMSSVGRLLDNLLHKNR